MKPRVVWRNAIWESSLSRNARLVAFAYEKHAGNGLDCVWVAGDELRRLTAMSRDTANRALRELEDAGWLVVVEKAKQHRSTRYRLAIPSQSQQSQYRNADAARGERADTPDPFSSPILRRQQSQSAQPGVRGSETNSDQNQEGNSSVPPEPVIPDDADVHPSGLDLIELSLGGLVGIEEQQAAAMLHNGYSEARVVLTLNDLRRKAIQ